MKFVLVQNAQKQEIAHLQGFLILINFWTGLSFGSTIKLYRFISISLNWFGQNVGVKEGEISFELNKWYASYFFMARYEYSRENL